MSKKKDRPLAPRDIKRQELSKRAYIICFVLFFCSIAKIATAILFDLGGTDFAFGYVDEHLAVESGLGRFCTVVGLLVMAAAGFGFKVKEVPDDKTIRNICIVAIATAVVCLVAFGLGLHDNHHPLDNVVSLLCAAVAGYFAWSSRQISLY